MQLHDLQGMHAVRMIGAFRHFFDINRVAFRLQGARQIIGRLKGWNRYKEIDFDRLERVVSTATQVLNHALIPVLALATDATSKLGDDTPDSDGSGGNQEEIQKIHECQASLTNRPYRKLTRPARSSPSCRRVHQSYRPDRKDASPS